MSDDAICKWCGTYESCHGYEHLARECFPKRIERLEDGLRDIIRLDHHNHGPDSRATKIARDALNPSTPAAEVHPR